MTDPRIHVRHLERFAFVYVRQSSLGQVRKNLESQKRQSGMQEHVQRLGWPAARVRLFGDPATSGSSQHGRHDYQALLEAVVDDAVGIVAAAELSRLARDDQDWSQLVRLCRYHGVLLADDHRVYDAGDPQDRVLLGVQGAFNEFELAMITERMLVCRRQKAQRGELYEGLPPGYICRRPPLQEKHPDKRVQRALQKVFDDFQRQPSVYGLFRQLAKEQFELPFIPPGRDWREIEWRVPSYDTLLGILCHPGYAGIYVRGRRKTVHELDEAGHLRRRVQRLPREEWEVFLPQHHQAYISQERWERNMAKIAANAARSPGNAAKRAPGKGSSLLAGVLRCRRCGHRLQVSYSKGLRYLCRGGALQRGAARGACFSFAGGPLEEEVETLLLEVVRPAGLAAAERAAEQLAANRARQRSVLADRVSAAGEDEARAAREYKATDEAYLEVRRKLAAEWDAALQKLHQAERRLAEFDAPAASSVTAAQRRQLQQLSSDLTRVWHHKRADGVLKKQIVRTLIEEIVVDVDQTRGELLFWVHWRGGHHTDHRLARRGRRAGAAADLSSIVNTLRKILADSSLAASLNRVGLRTPGGKSWTPRRVAAFRREHKIASYSASLRRREGWLTQAQCATRLEISPMSISRLVNSGILPAERAGRGLPTVIRASDLDLPAVQCALHKIKTRQNRPLPADPNQLILFTPEDF
jgi:DNA invertase Pin-like site-specific DNA recombinase